MEQKYVYEKDGKELCPYCGNEVILDEYTLHNCGWDARWCWHCGRTVYWPPEEEEE